MVPKSRRRKEEEKEEGEEVRKQRKGEWLSRERDAFGESKISVNRSKKIGGREGGEENKNTTELS